MGGEKGGRGLVGGRRAALPQDPAGGCVVWCGGEGMLVWEGVSIGINVDAECPRRHPLGGGSRLPPPHTHLSTHAVRPRVPQGEGAHPQQPSGRGASRPRHPAPALSFPTAAAAAAVSNLPAEASFPAASPAAPAVGRRTVFVSAFLGGGREQVRGAAAAAAVHTSAAGRGGWAAVHASAASPSRRYGWAEPGGGVTAPTPLLHLRGHHSC